MRAVRAPVSEQPKLSEPPEAEQAAPPTVGLRENSSAEKNLADDFRYRFVAPLRENRIQLALDSAQRARALLHQGRSHLHPLRARQMRDECVAARVDSADCDHVDQIFALLEKRVRLRQRAR